MKIRYYIKGVKNKDLILNEKRGGYLYIEHHKINRFEKINSVVNISENVLFDFEFKKISKASGIFKESKITHKIKILDKQEYIDETIYLKPNIIQKYRLYLNNRKTTNWIKNKSFSLFSLIIAGIIGAFINQQFQNNKELKNAPNIPAIKQSIKNEILLELKDSYLISNDTLTRKINIDKANKVQ